MYIHYFLNYSILKTYLLFIQPICRFVGIYFILRVIIQYCVTFLLTNIPALAIESSFRLAPMSLCAHHCSVVLFCFQAPLILFSVPGSSCTLPVSALESGISPRTAGSLNYRMVLERWWPGVGHVPCYWDFTGLRPAQGTELGNLCIYTNPCFHTHLSLFLYLSICI